MYVSVSRNIQMNTMASFGDRFQDKIKASIPNMEGEWPELSRVTRLAEQKHGSPSHANLLTLLYPELLQSIEACRGVDIGHKL